MNQPVQPSSDPAPVAQAHPRHEAPRHEGRRRAGSSRARTTRARTTRARLVSLLAAAGILTVVGCSSSHEGGGTELTPVVSAPAEAPAATIAMPTRENPVLRVGGNMESSVTRKGEEYRYKGCRVDTPLPVGYPAPTAPGAIELKWYPSVRRAEVTGKATQTPEQGRNSTFWPLFKHIESRQIAMTAPVEMDYRGGQNEPTGASNDNGAAQAPIDTAWNNGHNRPPQGDDANWSMAFLYRTQENGPTGEDGVVKVYDAPEVMVISIGQRGSYSKGRREEGIRLLREWLSQNPQWEEAGPPRGLLYNDPFTLPWNMWSETQIPVRPAASVRAGG